MQKNLFFSVLMVCLINGVNAFSQINVTPGQSAAVLAQTLAGQGVTILNPTLNCPSNANGTFSVISSNIGLDSGIVLTNGQSATVGRVYGINGPSAELASKDNGGAGDPAMNDLARANTMDACDLEFDIVPSGDTVRFNYFFSSEEYINAVCGPYNDVFAFFISGPGISGIDNMALIPGTNIPVTINSINNGIVGRDGNIDSCTAMGPGSPFTAYYINNSAGTTLTHQGFTQVLAAVHAVASCSTYHLKIEIVDAGDPNYDSGVFLQAGSLQATDYHVDALATPIRDTIYPICVKGCLPGTFIVKTSQTSSLPQALHFILSGTASPGVDFMPVPDSVVIPADSTWAPVTINGIVTADRSVRSLKLYLMGLSACAGSSGIIDSASMLIYDAPYVNLSPADTFICGNDTLQLNAGADSIYAFSWSPNYEISNDTIADPKVYPAVNTNYRVTVSLQRTSCAPQSASTQVNIRYTPELQPIADTTVCYHGEIQLSVAVENPSTVYSYLWIGPSGFTSTLAAPTIDSANAGSGGYYQLTVENDTNHCKAVGGVQVAVNIPSPPRFTDPQQFCIGSTQEAMLTAVGENILWYGSVAEDSGSSVAPVIPNNFPERFTYFVTQTVGQCTSPKVPVTAVVEQCCNGNVFVPNAFVPNSSGINRTFNIFPDYGYYIKSFMVFNRWGQLVYTGDQGGWDGTYHNTMAEMGTYYYQIVLGCVLGGEFHLEGDVNLIR